MTSFKTDGNSNLQVTRHDLRFPGLHSHTHFLAAEKCHVSFHIFINIHYIVEKLKFKNTLKIECHCN